jgi:hypothetical protein
VHKRHCAHATHCLFVRYALAWARAAAQAKDEEYAAKGWRNCLSNLRHAHEPIASGARNAWSDREVNPVWLTHICDGTMVADLLADIEFLSNEPPPLGPEDSVGIQIREYVAGCRHHKRKILPSPADERGNSWGNSPNQTVQHHCGFLRNARDAALAQDWGLCVDELDHMVGTLNPE